MNSYLLENADPTALKIEEDKIIQKEKFTDALKDYYDLEETTLDNALEDLDTYSFLVSKKIIIIKGIENLKYEEIKESFDHLLKYIKNPVADKLLIIEAKKLNNTSKITKELKKICLYETDEVNTQKLIKDLLKDYQISDYDIKYLEEKCLSDISKITNECQKLKSYKLEEKIITKEDIDTIVVRKLGDSKDLTFHFSRALAEKDKKEALKSYEELLNYQIEPLSILGLIASQIRIIYQVKILEKDRKSNDEIAEILGEKSAYRIKKTRELTRLYTEKELLNIMTELSNIDLKIKTTDSDPTTLIELFIINNT